MVYRKHLTFYPLLINTLESLVTPGKKPPQCKRDSSGLRCLRPISPGHEVFNAKVWHVQGHMAQSDRAMGNNKLAAKKSTEEDGG